MILRLMEDAKMSASEISEALGERVSKRTVYRWAKGESEPQQARDLIELTRLYADRCSSASSG